MAAEFNSPFTISLFANNYRVHSMATKSSQLPPLQVVPLPVGMAPVMSSRSTLRNDSA